MPTKKQIFRLLSSFRNKLGYFIGSLKNEIWDKYPRIVVEGDSWACYPVGVTEDLSWQLAHHFYVFPMGEAGDEVQNYITQSNMNEMRSALTKHRAVALFISGGGNDILGMNFQNIIKSGSGGDPMSYIHESNMVRAFRATWKSYGVLIASINLTHPDVHIFAHGYAVPFMRDQGVYLAKPFDDKGVPQSMRRIIVARLLEEFAKKITSLEPLVKNFHFIDIASQIPNNRKYWIDEIHPSEEGFAKARNKLVSEMTSKIG